MKIAILSAFHETNTFSSVKTDKKNFLTNTWLEGEAITASFMGTKTPIGGFLDTIKKYSHQAVPLFAAHATPAGTVEKTVFDEIRENFKRTLLAHPEIDAVALELHGAHVVEGIEDPEAILCAEVRALIGDKPLAVVTDFHANMSKDRLKSATVWAGYRTNPHVDTYETAVRSLESLFYYLDNKIEPKISFIQVPIIYPPIGQATKDDPFVRVINQANGLREKYNLCDLIVHGGYSFSDISYAGLSFTAIGDDTNQKERAEALLELAQLAWDSKDGYTQKIYDVPEVIELVKQSLKNTRKVAIADIADNINGGSTGDSTHVIKALLSLEEVKILSSICDPKAVAQLKNHSSGDEVELSLGGWSDPIVGQPLKAKAKLIWQGDGTYQHEGIMNHGAKYTIGDAALVRVKNMDILIQSFAQQPNDIAQFKIAGIDLASYQVTLLKGAAALRANWTNRVDDFFNASSVGMTDCILERLNYQKLAKTVWPLNKDLIPTFEVQHLN